MSDRRRFRPDGSLREPAAEDEGGIDLVDETALNGDDTRLGGAADIDGPPAPSRTPAEDWERRALAAEARLRELADSLTRGRADLEAARARVERDREQRVREAVGRAFEKILVALDNLERALAHAADGPLAEGVRHVQRQILDAMAGEGLERIEVVGQPFDPLVAEAVATSPADPAAGIEPKTVIEEYRAGYRVGDRVLRPAQVRVAM